MARTTQTARLCFNNDRTPKRLKPNTSELTYLLYIVQAPDGTRCVRGPGVNVTTKDGECTFAAMDVHVTMSTAITNIDQALRTSVTLSDNSRAVVTFLRDAADYEEDDDTIVMSMEDMKNACTVEDAGAEDVMNTCFVTRRAKELHQTVVEFSARLSKTPEEVNVGALVTAMQQDKTQTLRGVRRALPSEHPLKSSNKHVLAKRMLRIMQFNTRNAELELIKLGKMLRPEYRQHRNNRKKVRAQVDATMQALLAGPLNPTTALWDWVKDRLDRHGVAKVAKAAAECRKQDRDVSRTTQVLANFHEQCWERMNALRQADRERNSAAELRKQVTKAVSALLRDDKHARAAARAAVYKVTHGDSCKVRELLVKIERYTRENNRTAGTAVTQPHEGPWVTEFFPWLREEALNRCRVMDPGAVKKSFHQAKVGACKGKGNAPSERN